MIVAEHADHILRVSAQGEDLPARGYAEAQRHLKTMLLKRMAQLAGTDAERHTSRREVDHSLIDLIASWKTPARRLRADTSEGGEIGTMFPVADMGGKACELGLFDGGVTVHEGVSEPVPDKRVIARQSQRLIK